MQTPLRVLVYNGDTDPGLNSFYAQNWTAALGYDEAEAWRPWTLDGKVAIGADTPPTARWETPPAADVARLALYGRWRWVGT